MDTTKVKNWNEAKYRIVHWVLEKMREVPIGKLLADGYLPSSILEINALLNEVTITALLPFESYENGVFIHENTHASCYFLQGFLNRDVAKSVFDGLLTCVRAGRMREQRDPMAFAATAMAKYYASRAAMRAAGDAVQLHGANGCSSAHSVARYFGDAKIMEIIEGSTQIQQSTLAEYGYQEYGLLRSRAEQSRAARQQEPAQ